MKRNKKTKPGTINGTQNEPNTKKKKSTQQSCCIFAMTAAKE